MMMQSNQAKRSGIGQASIVYERSEQNYWGKLNGKDNEARLFVLRFGWIFEFKVLFSFFYVRLLMRFSCFYMLAARTQSGGDLLCEGGIYEKQTEGISFGFSWLDMRDSCYMSFLGYSTGENWAH